MDGDLGHAAFRRSHPAPSNEKTGTPMKPSAFRLGALICVLSGSVLVSRAAQVVLVLRTGADSWQVLEAEKIAINSKSKVRIGSAGSPDVQPGEYKKLAAEEILRVGILRRHAAGYLVRKDGGNWTPIAPDGANFKAATSYAALWSSASIAIQRDRNAKGMDPVKTADVFAILPGTDRNEAVAGFLSDPANFRGAGEEGDNAAFEERMSLLVSAAGLVTGPSAEKLQQLILSEMETSNQHLISGIAHYSDLEHGLRYVAVSQKAWPNDQRQQKARTALLEKKQWLDQRIAILKAFNAGELWDAFLDKYGDFDRYDNSFEELRKLRDKALAESTKQHFDEGKRLYEAKQYGPAVIELKLAQRRSPGNKEVAAQIELVSIEDERTHPKPPPPDLKDPRQMQITRRLSAAKSYIGDRKWEEAESEIQQAEGLDKNSYRILLTRAELLEAQGKLPEALKVLDQYAKLVSAEADVTRGDELRGRISSELSSKRDKLKAAIEKAEAEGDYPLARDSAQSGVEVDPANLYFLLHAGRNNAIVRNRAAAKQQLEDYVRLSQTSAGDEKELAKVYGYLEALKIVIAEPEGNPNWYSGYKSPSGLFYCPVSLMPNARAADVKASRKGRTLFTWVNGQLTEARTQVEEPGTKDFVAYFDYFKDFRMVRRVADQPLTDKSEPAVRLSKDNGAIGEGKGAYVALLNDPVVDPLMVERLTGRRAATIVAGNPYFHPFVWNGIYRFLAEYDDQGRVKSAVLLDAKVPFGLDFRWEGLRLVEIAEHGSQSYRRTMSYEGGRLVAESISFRGKTSKIKYAYKGDQLTEAECGDDPSIDGRSRHVTFR
jgi:hypothetical protein